MAKIQMNAEQSSMSRINELEQQVRDLKLELDELKAKYAQE